MRKKTHSLVLFILLLLSCSCEGIVHKDLPVIPEPSNVITFDSSRHFTFSSKTTFASESQFRSELISDFTKLFEKSAGFVPEIISDMSLADVVFVADTTLAPEAYKLVITADKITVSSVDDRGLFYALQTLRQLLPPELESQNFMENIRWSIPVSHIEDKPRFAYRGLMLDVARYFIPKENVLKIIDAASMLKINKLHLHLVDDQGWRIEIKKYPRLIEIGAWRVYRPEPFPLRKKPTAPGEPTPIGGFYTQEDIKEMVKYAAERQIEIIPEIEMPAHTNSSLAAYPQYTCPVHSQYIAVLPGMGGRNSDVIYCAGNDDTFLFLENVLDEVLTLFPSQYIHLGGDEANKKAWEVCPKCRLRMKKEHIAGVEDLQGYFMNRMAKYVQSKGRTVIGWDEWTNSKIPEGAVITGWQGLGTAGYKAALLGHDFVMSPSSILYLDYYQGPQWFEPRGYFGNNTLKKVYDYEPVQADWDSVPASHLLGMQAALWTEFMESPQMVEHMIFPRLAALADIAWAPKGTKDWPRFLKRLDMLAKRWEYMNINYAHSMYNLDHAIVPTNGSLKIGLSCIRPDVEIRYTLDNSEPDKRSALYTDSIDITHAVTVKAATFAGDIRKGEVLILDITWNKATGKTVLSDNKKSYVLTNGLKGTDKYTDGEWCGWYDQDISFVLDLGKDEEVNRVELGHVVNYGMGVHYPKSIKLLASKDNINYVEVARLSYSMDEIFKDGFFTDELVFGDLSMKTRYLKFEIESPGECPPYHHRAGQGVWLYFDEIKVL